MYRDQNYHRSYYPGCPGRQARRRQIVRRQKLVLLSFIAIVVFSVLFGIGRRTFTEPVQAAPEPLHKYYTSIQVQEGDTLWDYADKYTEGTDVTAKDYIQDICSINHMTNTQLTSGAYIIIPYYQHR